MKLNSKGRYAVMAMADLAKYKGNKPINLTEISLRQGISLSFLEQLFSKLKKNNLVLSERGPGGGYILSKAPEDIKLSHIFRTYKDKNLPQQIINCEYGKSYTGTYAEANNKCHPDKPANTIKENHGAVMTHYELGRHLTPRELARLQSFPDTFLFPCSKTSALKQIGNAVPCLLAKAIGLGVKNLINIHNIKCGSSCRKVDFSNNIIKDLR